jgi:hypothetical protein
MATIVKLKSGNYRVQIRRKGQYASKTFSNKIDLVRVALRRLGLTGRSNQRDCRPTQQERDRLVSYFNNFAETEIPMARIIKFAVATGMRRNDIYRISDRTSSSASSSVTL